MLSTNPDPLVFVYNIGGTTGVKWGDRSKTGTREQFLFFFSFSWFFYINEVILTNCFIKKSGIKKRCWSTGLDLHFIQVKKQTSHSHLSYRQGKSEYLTCRIASSVIQELLLIQASSSEPAGTHEVTNDNQQPLLNSPKTQGEAAEGTSLGSLFLREFLLHFPSELSADNDLHFLLYWGPTHFLK